MLSLYEGDRQYRSVTIFGWKFNARILKGVGDNWLYSLCGSQWSGSVVSGFFLIHTVVNSDASN